MIRIERRADGTSEVVCEVTVGVDITPVRVPLGHFEGEVDPGGLRNAPVVVLTAEALRPVVRAGAERAGRAHMSEVRAGDDLPPGAGLLAAARTADVLLVVASGQVAGETLVVARALGGRPLPVIPFDDRASGIAVLSGCWVDLDVAVPSVDGTLRHEVRSVAEELGLFSRHHVVEVDPRAALAAKAKPSPFDEGTILHELAAAATGVLAGRIAAGNRR